ncbi:hypothetical protein PM082_023405 [Marasmius tenuissimus]|nr:hypothetical protein PM082_023405 [Marasmius tenuissimus]
MCPSTGEGNNFNASSVGGSQLTNHFSVSGDVTHNTHAPVYYLPAAPPENSHSAQFNPQFNPSNHHLSGKQRYVLLMSGRGNGSALWYPNGAETNPPGGIRIGDVGIMRPNLPFDCLYNICDGYPPNLPFYRGGVEITGRNNHERDHHADVCVNSQRLPESNHQSSGYQFESLNHSEPGAILVLPHGSRRETLVNKRSFLDFAIQYGARLFDIAEWRGRYLYPNDFLYLVTAVEKCQSWGICSFESQTPAQPVSLRLTALSAGENGGRTYSWEYANKADYHSYPYKHIQNPTGVEDQAVFVNGFIITRNGVQSGQNVGDTPEYWRAYFPEDGGVTYQFPSAENYRFRGISTPRSQSPDSPTFLVSDAIPQVSERTAISGRSNTSAIGDLPSDEDRSDDSSQSKIPNQHDILFRIEKLHKHPNEAFRELLSELLGMSTTELERWFRSSFSKDEQIHGEMPIWQTKDAALSETADSAKSSEERAKLVKLILRLWMNHYQREPNAAEQKRICEAVSASHEEISQCLVCCLTALTLSL